MWCAAPKPKLRKGTRWLSPPMLEPWRSPLDALAIFLLFTKVLKPWKLPLRALTHRELYICFSPPTTCVVRLWPWRLFSRVVELFIECVLVDHLVIIITSFVCLLFFVFALLCVGVGVFEAWCAFGCITFWMHFFPFLRFVVFLNVERCYLLTHESGWLPNQQCFQSAVVLYPIPLVWSRLVALLSSWFRFMWLVLKAKRVTLKFITAVFP